MTGIVGEDSSRTGWLAISSLGVVGWKFGFRLIKYEFRSLEISQIRFEITEQETKKMKSGNGRGKSFRSVQWSWGTYAATQTGGKDSKTIL